MDFILKFELLYKLMITIIISYNQILINNNIIFKISIIINNNNIKLLIINNNIVLLKINNNNIA